METSSIGLGGNHSLCGHSTMKRKAAFTTQEIDFALHIPVSISGLIERISIKYDKKLEYHMGYKTFRVKVMPKGKKNYNWYMVTDDDLIRLINAELKGLLKEQRIVKMAEELGILTNASREHVSKVRQLRIKCTNPVVMQDIIKSLIVKMDRTNRKKTE